MTAEQSRILTLVFTDLADSTALKTERGDQAVDDLITRHREHVARLAAECAGRVIDWAGDGCFLTFETSSAGVMFGLRLQKAHAEEPDLPGVRVGVHLGEVTEKAGPDGSPQVKGLAVDLAARVQGLARPGQVLLSAAVYDSARQRIGADAFGQPVRWQTHGAYMLKGFDKPLDIGEAGLEGLSPLESPTASGKAQPFVVGATGIAVVPSASDDRKVLAQYGIAAVLLMVVLALVAAGVSRFVLKETPQDLAGSGVDLLSLIDPSRDALKGEWKLDENGLVSPFTTNRRHALIRVPYVPPESYDLHLTVERVEGQGDFVIGLVVGGRQVGATIDGRGGQASGFDQVDEKGFGSNSTTVHGQVFDNRRPYEIRCFVRSDFVSVHVDERKLLEWSGDVSDLSMPDAETFADVDVLFLRSYQSVYRVSAYRLEPVSGNGTERSNGGAADRASN